MIVGWGVALLGLVVVAFAYHQSIGFNSIYKVGPVRGDYLGGMLVGLGVIIAGVFHFIPGRRAVGLAANAAQEDIEREVRYTNGQVLLDQILVGVGLGLIILGFAITIYYLKESYAFGSALESTRFGINYLSYYVGIVPVMIGAALGSFCLGRLGMARRARNLAVVAHQRSPAALPGGGLMPGGISEMEVRSLVKRLDGLMARLPDDAVTEFSRTPEADTYLKLLGS